MFFWFPINYCVPVVVVANGYWTITCSKSLCTEDSCKLGPEPCLECTPVVPTEISETNDA